MAAITVQPVSTTGTVWTLAAASGGGDTVRPSGNDVHLIVRNGDASSKTVTLVRAGNDQYGVAIPDLPVAVAAGATLIIPVPATFRDTSDDLVDVTYSATTSVTVGAFKVS